MPGFSAFSNCKLVNETFAVLPYNSAQIDAKGLGELSDSKLKALIIADVQNDFCPGGALAVPHGDEIIPRLNELTKEFLDRGDVVVKSRDWHPPDTNHFITHGGTWPIHCVRNTPGAEFHPDLLDDPRIIVVSKGLGDGDNYSAFDRTDLAMTLRDRNVEEIWVGGLATDYCVKDTVLDGLKAGFKVVVLTDAMRAVDLRSGDGYRAIETMRQAGAQIIDRNILGDLRSACSS
jgi:nicotinamidase/pyrazinamidase